MYRPSLWLSSLIFVTHATVWNLIPLFIDHFIYILSFFFFPLQITTSQKADNALLHFWNIFEVSVSEILSNAYVCVFKWKRQSLLHQYATCYRNIIVIVLLPKLLQKYCELVNHLLFKKYFPVFWNNLVGNK